MTATDALYTAFLRLRAALVQHGAQYVSQETAEGLAGEAIADLVRRAMEGASTPRGPWAHVWERLFDNLHLMREDHWEAEPYGYVSDVPAPPDGFAEELCIQFGSIFDAAYEARLTGADKVLIQCVAACGVPPVHAEATLLELITIGARHLEPLRRAFFAVEEHESGRTAVCYFSGRLSQRELQAHRRWAARTLRKQEVNQWHA